MSWGLFRETRGHSLLLSLYGWLWETPCLHRPPYCLPQSLYLTQNHFDRAHGENHWGLLRCHLISPGFYRHINKLNTSEIAPHISEFPYSIVSENKGRSSSIVKRRLWTRIKISVIGLRERDLLLDVILEIILIYNLKVIGKIWIFQIIDW